MRKQVLEYNEQYPGRKQQELLMSIIDFPQEKLPIDVKNKVLDYMLSKEFCPIIVFGFYDDVDVFTGKERAIYSQGFFDDEWTWSYNLAQYVQDHDIKLPQEFIEHIFEYYDNGGRVKEIYWHQPPTAKINLDALLEKTM